MPPKSGLIAILEFKNAVWENISFRQSSFKLRQNFLKYLMAGPRYGLKVLIFAKRNTPIMNWKLNIDSGLLNFKEPNLKNGFICKFINDKKVLCSWKHFLNFSLLRAVSLLTFDLYFFEGSRVYLDLSSFSKKSFYSPPLSNFFRNRFSFLFAEKLFNLFCYFICGEKTFFSHVFTLSFRFR